jgi:hypothetical protein
MKKKMIAQRIELYNELHFYKIIMLHHKLLHHVDNIVSYFLRKFISGDGEDGESSYSHNNNVFQCLLQKTLT